MPGLHAAAPARSPSHSGVALCFVSQVLRRRQPDAQLDGGTGHLAQARQEGGQTGERSRGGKRGEHAGLGALEWQTRHSWLDALLLSRRRTLAPGSAQIALDVARGLTYLHSRRIIHFGEANAQRLACLLQAACTRTVLLCMLCPLSVVRPAAPGSISSDNPAPPHTIPRWPPDLKSPNILLAR